MESLRINVLGELEVRRGERVLALPPSRKTRALLAYLVLGGRAYRRDQLCELFWDVADDPRAQLRWSLSKLRAILDDGATARVEADREEVAFRAHGATTDALEVRRVVTSRSLGGTAVDELERIAGLFRGELLEGLDLPDFDVYQAWCVAHREEMRQARLRVLAELVARLRATPTRAIEHARTRVLVDPTDTHARSALIELLGALGRRDEARAHFDAGVRAASGAPALAQLEHAWKAASSAATVAAGPPVSSAAIVLPPVDLVGRDRELALLDKGLAHVRRTRKFAATTFTAPLGTGKSRLLEVWLARTRPTGATVASTTAFEGDRGRPYSPWVTALAQLAREPAELLERASDRERLYDGVASAVADAAHSQPVILAIDDAHWLDAEAAGVLGHLARRCEELPVFVVLMARPGELDDNVELARTLRGLRQLGTLAEHELGPLGADAIAQLVATVRGDLDPELVHARSGGNPLFALELARTEATDATPRSLPSVIRDRLASLPDDAGHLLRWAAVWRRDISTSELEWLCERDAETIVVALELLRAHGLLVDAPGSRHTFAHELVRQVVYDGLSEPRRRLMHRRIAEQLAAQIDQGGDIDIADIAHHAAAAADSALATRACLRAAHRSLRQFAVSDAAALARRGLRHAESLADPERTRASLELVEVLVAARPPIEVDPLAKQVEALAERALDLSAFEHARLGYHLLSYLRWERGAWSDAQRHMRHAQMISRSAPESEQIVGMAEAARCLVLLEKDLPEAQALALEAQARGRIAGFEPPATFVALGMLHLHRGQHADGRAELTRALSLARVRRDRLAEYQALEQLAMLELAAADAERATTAASELLDLGTRFGEGSEAPFARGMHALCSGDGPKLDAALAELVRVDAKQRFAYLASRAAWRELAGGVPERARELARAAVNAARALDRATELALASCVLARLEPADAAPYLAVIRERWADVAHDVRASVAPYIPEVPS